MTAQIRTPAARVLVLTLVLALTGWGPGAQQARPSALIDSRQLLDDLRVLSADDMEGREFGTRGGAKARAYVVERFRASGIAPLGAGYEHPFSFNEGGPGGRERRGANVLGFVPGSRQPQPVMVVSAHFDHEGVRGGAVFNGADDNASGTAALFALAAYLERHPPVHSIVLAAFDGEEADFRGARAFVERPPIDLSSIALNVNLDMIGRDADDRLYAAGTAHYPFLRPPLERVAAKAPVKLLFGHDGQGPPGSEDWTTGSDHYVFHRLGIPFVYLGVEDAEHHHKPSDDYASMTHDFYVRAVETVVQVVEALDADLPAITLARRR